MFSNILCASVRKLLPDLAKKFQVATTNDKNGYKRIWDFCCNLLWSYGCNRQTHTHTHLKREKERGRLTA